MISVPGRWFGFGSKFRRDLPAAWEEVAQARRLPLLRALVTRPGTRGRLDCVQMVLDLPRAVFLGMNDLDIAAILERCDWLDCNPNPEPVLLSFEHRGRTYHAPKGHGLNLVALEYPIADEAFGNFLRTGSLEAMRLLIGTLYREENPDKTAVERRGDVRVPLLSRWEAEARAGRLAGVPTEVATAALMYFAGLKLYIHRMYGKALFGDDEQEKPGADGAGESNTANPIGWWGVYFNVAQDGPFGRNVEEVYQTSFHDVCLYLVDRKRQMDRMQMNQRMQAPDFGTEIN